MRILPVAQYPDIIPPEVSVTTQYPGASAEVIAATVAAPLEQKINGVDNMRGEIDFKESLRRRLRQLRGLPASTLASVADRIPLNEGAERLITNLKRFGYTIAIISGGFTYFGYRLKERLGIDYVFANELEIADGKLTGEVVGDIVDAAKKAEILRMSLAARGARVDTFSTK